MQMPHVCDQNSTRTAPGHLITSSSKLSSHNLDSRLGKREHILAFPALRMHPQFVGGYPIYCAAMFAPYQHAV